ncbi:hypothetical protein O181_045562 [Austropuccinia psidii MF-1]|uniref:Uncharacterized protein n=1 Tax=Austropuccinia psidii MF-1 TaxID=1389203 RepID=A0A9Q3DU43_9BASI|nr:hypothetical protein [Austropuccinia psidii MF-1]
MENARTSTSSQRLDSTFDTLMESTEAEITAIAVVRPKSFPEGSNRDIPVSVQELVYGSQAEGVGTSSKSLDMYKELSYSSEEFHRPRKYRRASERLETHAFQGTSLTHKSLVETPKHVFRAPEEEVGPRKGQQPIGSSSSLQKKKSASTSAKQGKANTK